MLAVMKWEKVSYELLIEIIIKYPMFNEDTKMRIVDVVSKNNGNAVMKKYFVNSFINAAKKVDYIGLFAKLKNEGKEDNSRTSTKGSEKDCLWKETNCVMNDNSGVHCNNNNNKGNNALGSIDEEMFNFDYNHTITNAKIEIVNENPSN